MSGVGVWFLFDGVVVDVEVVIEDGFVFHYDVLFGVVCVYCVEFEGVEELVLFMVPCVKSELCWSFAIELVCVFCFAYGVLELFDHVGVLCLCVVRFWVIDVYGVRYEVELEVDGCVVDCDSMFAWGCELVELDVVSCELVVCWVEGFAYFLFVDFIWVFVGTFNVFRSNYFSMVFMVL
jgi:hypothetical protein